MQIRRSRIYTVVVIVMFILAAYIFQLMNFQVTQGESFRQQSERSTTGKINILAPRGQILDRYGRVLATNNVSYGIILERQLFPSTGHKQAQNDELLALTKLLSVKGEAWNDTLPVSPSAPYQFTGSASDTKNLIKYINSDKKHKLSANSDAGTVVKALKEVYGADKGYSEQDARTVIGIKYDMYYKSGFTSQNAYVLAKNVSIDTVTKVQEQSGKLPGTDIQLIPQRTYTDGTMAPYIVGLVKKKDYSDQVVGSNGIEASMDKYLIGQDGTESIEVNKNGEIADTNIIKQPKPGDNIVLTIDTDLQKRMQDMLPQIIASVKADSKGQAVNGANARAAAGVVINVKTGEVLAMATYPSYDTNTYKQNITQLLHDPASPLLNRCIQGVYRPGSTFKPIVAVSGLMNGKITAQTVWQLGANFTKYSNQGYTGHDDAGLARTINVEGALSYSSNVFFNTLGDMLGITAIDNTAKIFNIGQKTGIELPGEKAGVMSSPSEKNLRGEPWYPADTVQASIGQLDTVLTPLQLANYVSILVNGGKQNQVHIVKQINSYDNTKVVVDNNTPKVTTKTDIPANDLQTVKQGMLAVTENGTAATVFDGFNMQIGGKTGTAQIPNGFNGVFVCFAPYNDPEIAVATVVEYGHNGFQTAPAAKAAIEQYFGLDDHGNPLPQSTQFQQNYALMK